MTTSRSVALVAILFGCSAQVAIAQSGDARSTTLEEIIVTAQKREQNINDVPIAINAFSADDLSRFDVGKPEDIKFLVPGLDIYNNVEAGGLSISLRGMSIFTFTPTSDPSAAVYVDDAYMASLAQVAFQSFDMEAVEVLKGPQGTLFGRNTPAGLIHFRTKKPTQEFEVYVRAEAGDYGAYAFEGVVSGGISDTVSGRLSVRESLFDGYFENHLNGENTGGVDTFSTRGQLLFEPSEKARILLSLHFDRMSGTSTPFASRGLVDPLGGLCSSFMPLVGNAGATGDDFRNAFDGASAAGCTDYLGFNEPDTDPFTVSVDSFGGSGVREGEGFGMRVNAEFELNDSMTLTSVTSYEYDDQFWEAIQFSPDQGSGSAELPQQSDVSAFSQEIRLASATDNMEWVAGWFLSYDDITFDIVDSVIFALPYSLFGQQKTISTALFGNVDWHLNDQWTVTAGLRGTYETRDAIVDVISTPDLTGGPDFKVDDSVDTTNLSGKIGISFQATEDMLLYANISTGFKSPGYNTAFVAAPIEVGPTREEKITAYEGGLKTTLFDGRMQANLTAYYYDRQDAQGVDFVSGTVPPMQGLTNFGDAELYGFEADIQWKPTENLNLAAGIALQDTEVTSGTYKGNTLPGAPEVTATLMARYDLAFGDWRLTPQVDARFVDERHRFIGNALAIAEIDGVAVNGAITDLEPGYWQLNASVQLSSPDERVLITGRVSNILDEAEYISYPFFNELTALSVGEPRNVKFSVTYRF